MRLLRLREQAVYWHSLQNAVAHFVHHNGKCQQTQRLRNVAGDPVLYRVA